MSRITKIISGIVMTAVVVSALVMPAKADAASDALAAQTKYLQQIAEKTAADKAWVEAQSAKGMELAIAHQKNIDAAAAAGLARAQADLDKANNVTPAQAELAKVQAASLQTSQAALDAAQATLLKDAAAKDAAALKGMELAIARQKEIDAAAAAGITSGQALLDKIAAETAASAAALQAAAASGMK